MIYNSLILLPTSDKPSYVNLKGQEVSLENEPVKSDTDDRGGRGDMGKVAD